MEKGTCRWQTLLSARRWLLILAFLFILSVRVCNAQTPKPTTKGTFVDRNGVKHPWYINQAHTLFWDGKPWFPAGGMFCPPYIWEQNDSGWALTTAQLDLLKEKGVQDLYVHFAGPAYLPAEALQRIIDALDERGFHYGIEITMNPEPGPAWCVADTLEVEIKADTAGTAVGKVECKGASRALFSATDAVTGELILTGIAEVDGDLLSAAVTLKPSQTAKIRFVPVKQIEPFFWESHYEAYENKIRDYYSKLKFGPGFRFVVDPFQNEMQVNSTQIPAAGDYSGRFEKWLQKRYVTPEKLAAAWAGELKSFAEAAVLVPVSSSPAVLVNSETGASVKINLAASQYWDDQIEFHGEEVRDYCNRVSSAFRKIAEVPVIFKHSGPVARWRVNDAGGIGGFDGIGMEPYGTGETAVAMNAAVCYSEAEQAGKTTWLIVTETSEAAFDTQLEKIGYLDQMSMYQQLSSLVASGAKGVFLFGLSFGPSPGGQFWMSEFVRDPQQLGWLARFGKILENAPELAEYKPCFYYQFPALNRDREAFQAQKDFAGIDGNWTGGMGQNGRNIRRAANQTWILPAFRASVETPLLIANLERAPASARWGAELGEMIKAKKRVAYLGFRYDLGAIPELDRYFTDKFSTDSEGRKCQVLKIVPEAEVLERGSGGSVCNMVVGNLQIISKEVPDLEGWHPAGLRLPKDTSTPPLTQFMEKVLGCTVLDSKSARAISFKEMGVPITCMWSLDKEGFRIPVGGLKEPAKVEYPDGSAVPVVDNKVLVPLEEIPALVETPVPYVRGKHCDTREKKDSLVLRSLSVFPPIEMEDPNLAEFEAECFTESNWGPGRFGGLTRLSESAMWALDTFVDPPRFGSYHVRYLFQWKNNQKLHLWVREQVGGSPCRWRINLGPWNEVAADVKDEGRQFIAPWAPFDDSKLHFAWHYYGSADITADENLLEIEVLKKRPKGDKYSKFLDMIVLASDNWKPAAR